MYVRGEERKGGRVDESQFFKTGNSSREPEDQKKSDGPLLLYYYWIGFRHTHTPGNGSLLKQKIKVEERGAQQTLG